MKRFFAAALAVVLLLCTLSVGAGASFTDISDPATMRDAAVLEQLGVIDGIGGGLFMPEGTLTRAQFCKMAVCILGKQGEAAQYAASSVFTDVRGSHWASGYIHYCVRNKIVLGIGDGSFAPDREIYFSEAVTVLMRVLGYQDTDFALPWPNGYIAEAKTIGLSKGLESLTGASIISRAQAVMLFKNLLLCDDVNGMQFASKVYGGLTDSSVVLAVGGNKITAMTDGGVKEYTAVFTPENNLVGTTCRFITDGRGYVRAAVATDALSSKTVTVDEAKYTYILDTNGGRHFIGSGTVTVVDGVHLAYESAWLSIRPGSAMTVYYDDIGSCVLVTVTSKAAADSDVVMLETAPANLSALAVMFGLEPNGYYTLYKNGTASDVTALKPYDVVTVDRSTLTFYASDFRLTGYYESAWPNYETPTKITSFGKEFELSTLAQKQIMSLAKGARVTLLLTDDLRVGAVVNTAKATGEPVALADSVTEDSATVTFSNGLTFTAPTTGNFTALGGRLVKVRSDAAGKLTLSRLDLVRPNKTLNTASRTLGDAQLSAYCAVYDTASGRCPKRINVSEIPLTSFSDVLHAGYDTAGRVNLLVLNNATGTSFEYGLVKCSVESYVWFDGSVAERDCVAVINSRGDTARPSSFGSSFLDGRYAGVSFENGTATSYVLLTEASCTRTDFVNGYAVIGGTYFPISPEVQCYIRDTNTWVTSVDAARTASPNLKVYYDKPASEGGQIRIITAG